MVWIEELEEHVMDLSLVRMRTFMEEYGALDYAVVHVGGTNGKGSVCHFMGSVLRRNHTVGMFTSPHLERITERITVNGVEIAEEELEAYAHLKSYGFTYFEALTAAALLHFRDNNVDYAVMEVGLGGRLDATNMVDARVTVITNVAREHEHILGTTVAAIAEEKAGIIKRAPVVTACRDDALAVIQRVAEERKVPVYVVGEDVIWRKMGRRRFLVEADDSYIIESPLDGVFQGENIALAVKACEILGMAQDDIIQGIENTRFPGRMEKMGRFLLDGCHNPHAVQAFARSLAAYDPRRLVILFGVMRDKNVHDMIRNLPDAKRYIAVTLAGGRSMDAESIARIGRKLGKPFEVGGEMAAALQMAEGESSDDDLICIVGSFYAVGEARRILKKQY